MFSYRIVLPLAAYTVNSLKQDGVYCRNSVLVLGRVATSSAFSKEWQAGWRVPQLSVLVY